MPLSKIAASQEGRERLTERSTMRRRGCRAIGDRRPEPSGVVKTERGGRDLHASEDE